MKYKYLILLLLLPILVGAQITVDNNLHKDDLQLIDFSEIDTVGGDWVAKDQSGNGYDMKLVESSYASFDGVDDFGTLPFSIQNAVNLEYSVTIRTEWDGTEFWTVIGSSLTNYFGMKFQSGGTVGFAMYDGTTSLTINYPWTNDGEWHTWKSVVDSTSQTIYLDGDSVAVRIGTMDFIGNTTPLIGKTGGSTHFGNFEIKEFEFSTSTNTTKTRFSSCADNWAYDISGNGNHIELADDDYWVTGNVLPYNLTYGCDIWLNNSDSSRLRVPYTESLNPIKTTGDAISGYTWASTNPGGNWHNNAETKMLQYTNATLSNYEPGFWYSSGVPIAKTWDEIPDNYGFKVYADISETTKTNISLSSTIPIAIDGGMGSLILYQPNTFQDTITVLIDDNDVYARTNFTDETDLVQKITLTDKINFGNDNINLSYVWEVPINAENTVAGYVAGTVLAIGGDDACPSAYNGTFIGANHGCSDIRRIPATSHGKTNIDVGSKWVDGSAVNYYIMRVIDANQLWVLSENIGTADVFDFDTTISGNLTHVSGATHTADIVTTSNALDQLEPAYPNTVKSVLLDGIAISGNGIYKGGVLDITDTYSTVNPASLLDTLIANVTTDYTDNELDTIYQTARKTVDNSIAYQIQANGSMVIDYDWDVLHEIDISTMGFIQASKLYQTTKYPDLDIYVPKALPILVDARTWDLRNIESYNVAPTSGLSLTDTYWELPASPPDRVVEYLKNTSNESNVGFCMGYDQVTGLGSERDTLVTTAINLATTRKIYPHGLDDKLGNITGGTDFNCIAYRSFFDTESLENASSLFTYDFYDYSIVIIDYHTQATSDALFIHEKYSGYDITVIEKSSNLSLEYNTVRTDKIVVTVNSSDYAYAILKLTN